MKRSKCLLAMGLLGLATVGWAGSAQGTFASSPGVIGHVYVNDNTAGVNTISAFNRFTDGSLAPIAGSPFAAGGAGLGAGIGSQGSLQATNSHGYLLAADAGSNQISVLKINPGGSLTEVGSPVSSGGIKPVSIAIHAGWVYVANAGAGGSNYTGFTIDSAGNLTPLSNSTYALPDTANPGDVLFNETGFNLIGTEVNTGLIDSFVVGSDGRIGLHSATPAQGAGPFGSEFGPANPTQLFVSNAHNGGTDLGTVSAFSVARNGSVSSIGTSPYADNQNAPCWVTITPSGRYLYAVNTASSSISTFFINSNGSLSLLGSTPFRSPAAGEEDARTDPAGRDLYVVDSGSDTVSAFAINGGSLTELPSSPYALPAGAYPFGIVVVAG